MAFVRKTEGLDPPDDDRPSYQKKKKEVLRLAGPITTPKTMHEHRSLLDGQIKWINDSTICPPRQSRERPPSPLDSVFNSTTSSLAVTRPLSLGSESPLSTSR